MKPNSEQYEREAKLIYSIIVAGKSANFADKATQAFLCEVDKSKDVRSGIGMPTPTLFQRLKMLSAEEMARCVRVAKVGNYCKIQRAFWELCRVDFDLMTVMPAELEKIHGIGPKTSRFAIMWIRPLEIYAALDVHILRWMRNNGYPDAPKATPSAGKIYERLELAFIAEAKKRNKTPREFDYEIWAAGAGRTQETALPQTAP